VKFLVDAQLPRRCAHWLTSQGHDAVHTLDLPQANQTGDHDIATISDTDQRSLSLPGVRSILAVPVG